MKGQNLMTFNSKHNQKQSVQGWKTMLQGYIYQIHSLIRRNQRLNQDLSRVKTIDWPHLIMSQPLNFILNSMTRQAILRIVFDLCLLKRRQKFREQGWNLKIKQFN
ncbi:hypothetical protein FGO68_gene14147 [Halteria grandinella]|uniref:Uncharacterized protein n=1 Tax=Halteria grandinella TaxID=5974 RepID=A0A8J8T6W5_HALGN|nr:hypothetical protein FGO68_gene14147 [Halteria grandinella]